MRGTLPQQLQNLQNDSYQEWANFKKQQRNAETSTSPQAKRPKIPCCVLETTSRTLVLESGSQKMDRAVRVGDCARMRLSNSLQ